MNKKGIIFSFDALLSLAIIGIAILFVLSSISNSSSFDSVFLHKASAYILFYYNILLTL